MSPKSNSSQRKNSFREDVIWLAGLLEGEGCFSIRKTTSGYYPCVWLVMTDEDVILKARDVFGVGKIGLRSNGENKDLHILRIQDHKHAYAVMMGVYQWLGERRRARIDEIVRQCFVEKQRKAV